MDNRESGNAATGLWVVMSSAPERAAAAAALEHEGDFTMTGVGESMRPRYGPGTVVVVHPTSYFMLRSGMAVVYVNHVGRSVAHVLMESSPQGWIAKGLNNPEPDDDLVTPGNLVGVVVCAYSPVSPAPRPHAREVAMAESPRVTLLSR